MTVQTLRRDPVAAPTIRYAGEDLEDRAAVDSLIDAAFGPGRFAKTAERLREGNAPRGDLSICARADGELTGAVRLWPVRIGGTAAVFLGPIAVEAGWRRHGIGAELVVRACAAAAAAGETIVMLVGDLPFFGSLGFERAPAVVRLPGPVDVGRVLWRGLLDGALDGVDGLVTVPSRARMLPIAGEGA